MKIYIFKNVLTNKFNNPIFIETKEKLDYDYENMILLLSKDEKSQQKLKDQKQLDLYELGEYDEKEATFNTHEPTLIFKGTEKIEEILKGDKKVC